MICHLIGVNHQYQLRGYRGVDSDAFGTYLSSICREVNIDLIAEELSEWAIRKWAFRGATGSVARDVAQRLGIKHLFCDADSDERKSLGILCRREIATKLGFPEFRSPEQERILDCEERKVWPIRERFWLRKLQQMKFTECAFVLGSIHVDTFGKLLNSEGIGVQVHDWKLIVP